MIGTKSGRAGEHAVLLAAGAGSRLRDSAPLKPLAMVQGRSLLHHSLQSLKDAGVQSATIVVGNCADEVAAHAQAGALPVVIRTNAEWHSTPNGVSLLAAAPDIAPGTFLSMCDHLISPQLIQRLLDGCGRRTALAVDRRLGHPWVDESDVTRVRTKGRQITAIGKDLLIYDCYDTGLFMIGPELVDQLRQLPSPSLSAGVQALGNVLAIDAGDASWLDVDDARALHIAETEWRL